MHVAVAGARGHVRRRLVLSSRHRGDARVRNRGGGHRQNRRRMFQLCALAAGFRRWARGPGRPKFDLGPSSTPKRDTGKGETTVGVFGIPGHQGRHRGREGSFALQTGFRTAQSEENRRPDLEGCARGTVLPFPRKRASTGNASGERATGRGAALRKWA